MQIYLAGAISQEHWNWCKNWRKNITNTIESNFHGDCGIKIVDPMSDKEENTEYTAKDIYETDIRSVMNSDLIIAELDLKEYQHVGTLMELQQAFMSEIPILIWGDKHIDHYFISYIETVRKESWQELVPYVFFTYKQKRNITRKENLVHDSVVGSFATFD